MIVKADVEGLVEGRFASNIDADALDVAIAAAVRFYSRYNPTYVEDTLDLVAGTRVYDLPADFLFIDTFDWWPDGEVTAEGTRERLWDGVYRQSLAELRASEALVDVRFANGKIILGSTPAENETVNLAYYGLHQVSGGEYAAVPTDDLSIVSDLASAEILRMFGTQAALDPDYAEGLLSIKSRSVVQNVIASIDALQATVKARYGGY